MASTFFMLTSTGEVAKSEKTECTLEWRIPDFLSLMDRVHVYFSSLFSCAGTTWRLHIRINENIDVGLVRESSIPRISLEGSVGFKTLNGKKDRERYTTRNITPKGFEVYITSVSLQKTELLKRKSHLLPSNVLTVLYTLKLQNSTEGIGIADKKCFHCKEFVDSKDFLSHEKKCLDKLIKCTECSKTVTLKNRLGHECETTRTEGEPCTSGSFNVLQNNRVLHDLKELYIKKEDCDVLIKVQGKEFLAHRNILKARSSVFASTFRNDMKEKATGVVDIDDCDPSGFSDFLCFLYCGDMDVIFVENVFSLFTTADKYDVQDLRAECLKFMKENLSVDTFCDTITIALRHTEKDLVKLTTDFFTMNAPKIILTVKWQSFLVENPTQGNELFVKLLMPNSSN